MLNMMLYSPPYRRSVSPSGTLTETALGLPNTVDPQGQVSPKGACTIRLGRGAARRVQLVKLDMQRKARRPKNRKRASSRSGRATRVAGIIEL